MPPARKPKLAPYLVVKNAAGLINFVEKALGGKLTFIEKAADGRIHHAEIKVADSLVMLAEVPAGRDPFPAMLHLYVPDVDATYKKAMNVGAISVREPADQPDGDRRGGVRDAWGNEWWLSTPGKKSGRGSGSLE